jgi:hypothetical protein
MKTKKEILKWWCDRGKIVDKHKDSDWDSFWGEIDKKELKIETEEVNKKEKITAVRISKRGWRYKLVILFWGGEAVKLIFEDGSLNLGFQRVKVAAS